MDAITTSGLSKRFGEHCAVEGLDLRVPAGAVYGFLGGNGAGKSTTIRMLLGLLEPSAGEVRLFGTALRASTRQALVRRTGSLVESPALYDTLTARENLRLNQRLHDCPTARIGAVLEQLGLADAADRPVSGFSLGMRQRLGLALALLHQPELLVLDEPTNGLDPAGIREMRELLRTLPRTTGVSVFVSSHLLDEVDRIADHVGVVHAGRLRWQGPVSDIERDAELELGAIDPDTLRQVLRELSVAFEEGGADGYWRVAARGTEQTAAIVERVALSGAGLFHVRLRRRGLEELFFGLTGAAEPSQAGSAIAPAPAR